MRIGTSAAEPAGPDALVRLREELQRAADDGFSSAWMSNIFGLDALTALAVAASPGLRPAGLRHRRSRRGPGSREPGVRDLRAAAVLPRDARPGGRGGT